MHLYVNLTKSFLFILIFGRWDHQFFPPIVKPLHERELACWKVPLGSPGFHTRLPLYFKRENGIAAVLREPKGNETPEDLEKERLAEQHLIDTGMYSDFFKLCLLTMFRS